jgi:hypothetical protein
MAVASYSAWIDWDADGGLLLGDYEQDLDGWVGATFGTVPPTLSRSTVRAYHGAASLLVTWGGGAAEIIQGAVMGSFVVGEDYTATARVWVPASGGRHVVAAVAGIGFGSTSAATDTWTEVSITWTASATTHLVQLWTSGTPSAGDQTWVDFVRLTLAGEDVTTRTLARTDVTIQYGRDQARALAPPAAGRAVIEIDNASRDYSPDYTSSPLAGLVGPGRELRIEAATTGAVHTLLDAALDDYQVRPDIDQRSVALTALDGLGRLRTTPVSTALYQGVRTGEAIGYVLDAAGWSAGRDLDAGATTLRYWWEDGGNAFDAIARLVAAEGPGSTVHVGASGQLVFRDRHHRLLRTASATSQATFRDTGAEPLFSAPFGYDAGWRDVINAVAIEVQERQQASEITTIWQDRGIFTIAPGQSRQFTVRATSDPFIALQALTQGTEDTDPDIITTSGAPTITATYSRTAGQSTTLTLSVSRAAGSSATVYGVRVRGYQLPVARTLEVAGEDAASIDKYSRRTPDLNIPPWVGREDAAAIVDLVLGQRAERLPTVTIRLVSGASTDSTRLAQQLGRDLSDRIHVVEDQSGLDADFWIEQIKHIITEAGLAHITEFGCEKVPTLAGNLFRFDVTGAGFNDGVFAPTGIDDPDTMFIFDVAGQGFNDGLFAT